MRQTSQPRGLLSQRAGPWSTDPPHYDPIKIRSWLQRFRRSYSPNACIVFDPSLLFTRSLNVTWSRHRERETRTRQGGEKKAQKRFVNTFDTFIKTAIESLKNNN